MAQVPQISTDPLEVLTNRNLIEEPFINQFWGPGLLGGLSFLGVCMSNWFTRRPMLVGLQKHVIITGAGAALGKFIDDYRRDYLAEKDAVLRHYVQLHPEDFPPFERKKFSEVFEKWIPIR